MDGQAWYEKHGVTPSKDGWLDGVPQCKTLPVSNEKWLANIAANMRRDLPNAKACAFNPRTMVMVCGGVTARDFLDDIRAKALSPDYDVFCSNKTGEWLLEHSIVPQYHIILDPKPGKVKDVALTHPDITYLLAAHCDPLVFDALKNHKVMRFFCPSAVGGEENLDWKEVQKYAKTPMLAVCGGTMTGVRAFNIADALGYRRLEYYGFDACVASETEHYAYAKLHNEAILTIQAEDGREFLSTHIFADQARQMMEMRELLPWVKVTVHGDSFMSHMLRLEDARRRAPHTLRATPGYLALQRAMHDSGVAYGVSGEKHANTVHTLMWQLAHKYGSVSVLDYGCGQGTLKRGLAALPIVEGAEILEYDPGIPGKDAEPAPADIVVCTDVMEHVEQECIDNVLDHIERLAKKLVFFWIATGPAVKTLPDGRNAHITIKPADWWYKRINARFLVAERATYKGAVAFVGQAIEALHEEYRNKPYVAVLEPPAGPTESVLQIVSGETSAKFLVVNDMTRGRAKTLFTKEPVTIEWINRMKPGETLLDVGANVGSYTIWAGCRGVKVRAFEPGASNYEVLCRNIALNGLEDRVSAYCAALSDRPRLDNLYLATHDAGGSCNEFAVKAGHDLKPREIAHAQGCIGLRLDELVQGGQLPQPDHVKIDVDGFEHKVVEGGLETLRGAKTVLVEVNEALPEHRKMIELLHRAGFEYRGHQVDQARRQSGIFKGCAEYLFTRVRDDIDELIDRIMAAPIIAEPFAHIYIEGILPDELYASMCANLDVAYQPISEARDVKGYPERSVHEPKNAFWEGVNARFCDGRLRSAVGAKFGCYNPTHADETLLIRDTTGYHIGPHTDTMRKVASLLFYLPKDASLIGAGTSIYTPKQKGFTSDGSAHFFARDFELVRTMPFLPNSLFAFAKSNTSFHGVEPFTQYGIRNALLYDIRKQKNG